VLHLDLPVDEALTIGGFVTNRLRRIPRPGDFIDDEDVRMTVVEADERSVIKVRVERR